MNYRSRSFLNARDKKCDLKNYFSCLPFPSKLFIWAVERGWYLFNPKKRERASSDVGIKIIILNKKRIIQVTGCGFKDRERARGSLACFKCFGLLLSYDRAGNQPISKKLRFSGSWSKLQICGLFIIISFELWRT